METLELANIYLDNARTTNDPHIALALCHDTEVTLSQVARGPRRQMVPVVRRGIATAYVQLGGLLKSRSLHDDVDAFYKKAEKFGERVQREHSKAGHRDGLQENCQCQCHASHHREDSQEDGQEHVQESGQEPGHSSQSQPTQDPDPTIINQPIQTPSDSMSNDEKPSLFPAAEQQQVGDITKVPQAIFAKNIRSPAMEIKLPKAEERLSTTPQLATCLCLLKNSQMLEDMLDSPAREWLQAIEKDTDEQDRLKILATNLTMAVSRVLDAMADTKVKGLDREKLHEPLSLYLSEIKDISDPHLVYQAAYAYQALLYVPDDETLWQATLRRTGKVIQGVAGLVSAVKGLDLIGFMDGLKNIQQGVSGAVGVLKLAKSTFDGVKSISDGGKDFVECMKEGFGANCKLTWYPALRGAESLLRGGQHANFKKVVCEAPCRLDPVFQWGVCQLLGEVAADAMWDANTRQSAIMFLGEIYSDRTVWNSNANVQERILVILMKLASSSANDVQGELKLMSIEIHLPAFDKGL
ncbi:hypothetical protein BGX34_004409 [Mortierella sp. NVP85]|nr:hypothetical protein BGX34_004409 [Mortierella sp. NVP85]